MTGSRNNLYIVESYFRRIYYESEFKMAAPTDELKLIYQYRELDYGTLIKVIINGVINK